MHRHACELCVCVCLSLLALKKQHCVVMFKTGSSQERSSGKLAAAYKGQTRPRPLLCSKQDLITANELLL